MENEFQVRCASCLREIDSEKRKSSFPGTWHAVSDTAEAKEDKERERTIEKCSFTWEVERDAKKCRERVGRKEMEAERAWTFVSPFWSRNEQRETKQMADSKRGLASEEHFFSCISVSLLLCRSESDP